MSFLSQRRELLEDAYPGDIIGIPNHGVLQLGDTLTEGETLQFTGLPFFAPEIFHTVELADPMRSKQLRTGLQQLGEEGAIQVFRPHLGGALLLGAVGQLQFEVVAHRLKHEYGVEARFAPARYQMARWVTSDDPARARTLHRGQRASRRLRRRSTRRPSSCTYAHRADGGAGELAEDPVPRAARARRAGVPDAAGLRGRGAPGGAPAARGATIVAPVRSPRRRPIRRTLMAPWGRSWIEHDACCWGWRVWPGAAPCCMG